MFSQIFSFRTAEIGPSQRDVYIDPAALLRVAVIIIIFLLLVTLKLLCGLPPLRIYGVSSGQRAILVLIGIIGISSFWSPLPLTAAFRIFQLVVATFLVWFMITSWGFNGLDKLIWKLSLPVIVCGILNGIFAPGKLEIYEAGQIDFLYRFKENAAGHIAAIAVSYCLVQLMAKPVGIHLWKIVYRLLLATAGLFLFQSATGVILLFLAVSFIMIRMQYKLSISIVCFFLFTLLASLFFFNPLVLAGFLLGGKSAENILTLTGRLDLYPIAIKFGLKSPLWGYGFLGDSLLSRFDYIIGWFPQNAHNGYLSALLNFGIIGLINLIITFIYVGKGLNISPKKNFLSIYSDLLYQFRLVFLMLIVGNMVESWIGDKFTLLWPFFVSLAIIPSIIKQSHEHPKKIFLDSIA